MNMSYCRFENTLQSLRDCYNAMTGGEIKNDDEALSESELRAKKDLICLCLDVVNEFGNDDQY